MIFLLSTVISTQLAFSAPVLMIKSQSRAFSIELAGNPTTGYRWELLNYNQHCFKLNKQMYQPSTKNRIGGSGLFIFKFERLNLSQCPSQAKLIFKYGRPWDPSTQQRFEVNVKLKH